jgi:hypothetical protein
MTTYSAERLQHLFAAALELPEDGRKAFLQASCADEPELLSELTALLAADEQLGNRTIRPLAAELTNIVAATAPAGERDRVLYRNILRGCTTTPDCTFHARRSPIPRHGSQ